MEDIPLCEDTCGKMLECGRHTCHRQCHNGECETCRQIVTKACRCGRCSKELPCCQLFTCDFKCTKMRSCKRHPCKRKVRVFDVFAYRYKLLTIVNCLPFLIAYYYHLLTHFNNESLLFA